jgi:hypothetical protein
VWRLFQESKALDEERRRGKNRATASREQKSTAKERRKDERIKKERQRRVEGGDQLASAGG